jgi:hypothetical protein
LVDDRNLNERNAVDMLNRQTWPCYPSFTSMSLGTGIDTFYLMNRSEAVSFRMRCRALFVDPLSGLVASWARTDSLVNEVSAVWRYASQGSGDTMFQQSLQV